MVTALNTDNPGVLYAGGNFTNAGGHANADRIAKWDGSTWSAIGGTPLTDGQVFAIAYHAGTVYVGGTFQNAGGNADADFLAAWNGSTWASPCASTGLHPFITRNVNALQVIDGILYVGGSFANGADIPAADYLVSCDLATGVAAAVVDSTVHAFGGAVYTLTADNNGTLYAGGGFIASSGPFVGNNVYSSTGVGEVRQVTINRGTSKDVYVKIQNDGLVAASFKVTGTGGATGITALYFAGANNITAAVSAGTYATASIDARASIVLRVRIVVANGSAGGATLRTMVRSQSGTPPDAVRVAVTAR